MAANNKKSGKSATTESGAIPTEFAHMANDLLENGSKQKIYLSYRERRHISKVKMEIYEDVKYVGVDSCESTDINVPFSERYIGATNITYSFLASLYNINTSELIVCNVFEDVKNCIKNLDHFIRHAKRPNIEARLIGMQNGSDASAVIEVLGLLKKHRIPLVELDLFGNETRHIAMDSKQGMSFNILVNNMNYRPGELINKLTLDQFKRSIMQASSQK